MFPHESEEMAPRRACSLACPLGTVPEGYVNLIAQRDYEGAYELIVELNPLPSVCARVCHHPCEDECKRGILIDAPINIHGLKRFITDRMTPRIPKFKVKFTEKVAVIGAGPAGLTAAYDLAKKGYKVTVFESASRPGGMMMTGIPTFRLDKEVLASEIEALEKAGILFEYGVRVGRNPSVDDLMKQGFAAVLIAVGASRGKILPIEGVDCERVYDAVTLMKNVNAGVPIDIGHEIVVIGGGSVAMDTARAMVRLGAKKVTCAFVETRDSMPAHKWETGEAEAEGVLLLDAAVPARIIHDWVAVKGWSLQR